MLKLYEQALSSQCRSDVDFNVVNEDLMYVINRDESYLVHGMSKEPRYYCKHLKYNYDIHVIINMILKSQYTN